MNYQPILIIDEKDTLNEPNIKLNTLINRTLISQYSDSNLYRGNISSIKYLIGKYNDDFRRLELEIQNMYIELLTKYFDKVDVTVSIGLINDTNDNDLYVIDLDIRAYENNELIAKIIKDIQFNRKTLSIDYMSVDDISLREYYHPDAKIIK